MRFNQHIPSLFTLVNLFLGFIAIINIQQGNYVIACYILLAAGAFDSVDGKLARLLGIPTNFGKEIDSLADMVSFCLAPALLVYALYTQNMPGISGEIIASVPLIMGAIRLARFNTIEDKPTDSFIGLPTPVNALAVASLVLLMEHIQLVNTKYSQPRLLLPIILSLSYMMVSRVQYPKFPLLNLQSGKQNNYRLFGVILFIICFITAIFTGYQYVVLALFIAFYILSGLIIHVINLGNIETRSQET